ncbi:hypothetical protein JP75_11515 [Devosia riboflavina]|uniref:Phage tail assembly protein n=1 Tax=Devosia riboflavina TaxID=46914 RepID=A0A087M272_9HYPH|nr:phage tail assembly protein [Devosia riboflavina]KFL30975.1 hypothetical protein JP75_11515 [Devosia riboflavina]
MVEFPIVFSPSSPVEFEGNTYRRLTFVRPVNLVDVLTVEPITDAAEKTRAINASLAGVPVGVIAALSIEDQITLNDLVYPILALPPAVEA